MSLCRGKRVLITGGAGLVGSHLLDRLLTEGAEVTVADNLFSGSLEHVVKVFRKIVLDIVGHQPRQLVFDPIKPVGVLSRALDNSRRQALLGWKPRFDLETGLRRTVAWFLEARPASVETLV